MSREEAKLPEKVEEEAGISMESFRAPSITSMLPLCPISGCPVTDPVVDPDGNTYERQYILEWLERQGTSPLTRKPMRDDQLVPNRAVKALVDSMRGWGQPVAPSASPLPSPLDPVTLANTFQVFVKTLENRTIVISVKPSSTVFEVKCIIWEKEGIPVEEQRLICAGKEMKEQFASITHYYNVMPNSTIHLVLRLQGG